MTAPKFPVLLRQGVSHACVSELTEPPTKKPEYGPRPLECGARETGD